MPVTASDYLSLTLRINELEEIVAELKNDNEEKAKIIAQQTKQIEELKAKLVRYENPHTPSSAQRFKKKSEPMGSKRRGAPDGHRGATRPTPDRVVEVTSDQCYRCSSTNLEECGVEKQVIREHGLMRKIIGTFRSENGAEYYQYIASIFATWWLQGKDVYAELKKLLVNELCLK